MNVWKYQVSLKKENFKTGLTCLGLGILIPILSYITGVYANQYLEYEIVWPVVDYIILGSGILLASLFVLLVSILVLSFFVAVEKIDQGASA